MQKVLVIVGPTASGKSDLAVKLAKKFNGEIISADSRQVYKGLNIGSGKITKKEMCGIPHHLLDIESPKNVFTAADFVKLGTEAIEDISSRGKLPIICGGTGFYIDALLGKVIIPEVIPNKALREKLGRLEAPELFNLLKELDPKRAENIDQQNPVRLIRAIEIATALGAVPRNINIKPLYSELWIGIEWDKEKLHKRIHERALSRMKRGMVAEAKRLHSSGLSYKRMEDLGLEYRFLAYFLQGKISKEELIENIELGNKQYARTQMHYWKRNKEINWLSPKDLKKVESYIQKALGK